MCSGTIYWANIGRVVYAMTEEKLLQCTGNHNENPTMSVSAAYVFAHGQKNIELIGPITELEQETVQLQKISGHLDEDLKLFFYKPASFYL